jgi:hypothetical protein
MGDLRDLWKSFWSRISTSMVNLESSQAMRRLSPPLEGSSRKDSMTRLLAMCAGMSTSVVSANAKCCNSITGYVGLIAYGSRSFMDHTASENSWMEESSHLVDPSNITSTHVTGLLATIAGSILGGNPLPPGLSAPWRYELHTSVESSHRDVEHTSTMMKPGWVTLIFSLSLERCLTDRIGIVQIFRTRSHADRIQTAS